MMNNFACIDMGRNEDESQGSSRKSYDVTQDNRELLENIMRASSTPMKGFIVYLKTTATEHFKNNQPSPVISLPQIQEILAINHDDDSDDDVEILKSKKKKGSIYITLVNRAKQIMWTSKHVNNGITSGIYQTHYKDKEGFVYHRKSFNESEVVFFKENDSVEKVLGNYINHLKNIPALFEWIPHSILSEAELQHNELKKVEHER
jgi:hypothetical protein